MIKKADIVLLVGILILGLGASWFFLAGSTEGQRVQVTVAGDTYGVYDLNQDQTIEITRDNHTNYITIKEGTVSMSYSDCANQICVETGAISHTKDSIACLPNRVLVEILGSEGGDVDVISG